MPVSQLETAVDTNAALTANGIDPARVKRLLARIEKDVNDKLYPGAAVALARRGRLLVEQAFGMARLEENGDFAQPADSRTLWLLYSQTKPLTSCALWILAERGQINFHAPVAMYMPEFAQKGKDKVTAYHLLTHQSGFPNALVQPKFWRDHSEMRRAVCQFDLEWEPGTRISYHGYSAHWVQAALIEAVTGQDFRDFIKSEITEPLGLQNTFIGTSLSEHGRLAANYERLDNGSHRYLPEWNDLELFQAGIPGAGGVATAGDIAMFYQMLLHLGRLNGTQILAPRMVQYVVRNHTEERIDEFFGTPMHRALGLHCRGFTPTIYGLSSTAHSDTFGHGGMGTSYSWADPLTGVSFTYLTNSRLAEPLHSRRHEEIMTLAHATVVDLQI